MIPSLVGKNPDDYTTAKICDFAQAVMRAYWERDADIADAATISRLAGELGIDREALLAAAGSPMMLVRGSPPPPSAPSRAACSERRCFSLETRCSGARIGWTLSSDAIDRKVTYIV